MRSRRTWGPSAPRRPAPPQKSSPPPPPWKRATDIAEAVRELGLEADPEDVWAEVQGRRAGALAARKPVAARKRRRLAGMPAALAGVIAIPAGVLIGGRVIGAHQHQQGTAAAPWPSLSEMPDGVPVYAEAAGIDGFLHGRNAAQTMVSRSSGPRQRWGLILHDGKTYLRGYVLPQVAQPGYLSRLSLYSEGAVGELSGTPSQAITIPLNGAHWKDTRGMNDWDEFTLTGVQTDGHFHDRW